MKIIGIYRIISPTNKIYVGQSIDVNGRFGSYRELKCHQQPKLFNSLKKHGVDTHIFEIIEECDTFELNNRERYWQDFYNVCSKSGLNCRLTASNEKSGELSEDTKNKISSTKTGKKKKSFSKETKQRMSNAKIGVKHSEERKMLHRLSMKGMKHSDEHRLNNAKARMRPVIIDGVEYPSILNASSILSIHSSTIGQRCRKEKYTNYSYKNNK